MMTILENFRNKNKKAQATVEFALIFPIVIMTVMGIFEFGFLLKNYLGMNYALGKAAKEASMCRGQMGSCLKVVKALLKGAFMIDYNCLQILGPDGTIYGPYKLDSTENVLTANNEAVTTFPAEVFFYSDSGTPNNPSDDLTVEPSNAALPSYAKITAIYGHTMLCASIMGLNPDRSFKGMSGTFILKLSMQARLAPM